MFKRLLVFLGKVLLMLLIAYLCMLLGYFDKNALISIITILSIVLVSIKSINILVGSASKTGMNDHMLFLSQISWFACLLSAFLLGTSLYINNSVYIGGTFVFFVYFYVLGFLSIAIAKRIGRWRLIFVMSYIFVGFLVSFGIFKNILITSAFLFPFYIVASEFEEVLKREK